MSLKNKYQKIEDLFQAPPTPNRKAWGLIFQFYHELLTYMKNNDITKAKLAEKLGKSRASISQMFNKTPNLSIKRMVEITDAIGVNVDISICELKKEKNKKLIEKAEYSDKPRWSALNLCGYIVAIQNKDRVITNIHLEYSARAPFRSI